jgi:hypothetical protein
MSERRITVSATRTRRRAAKTLRRRRSRQENHVQSSDDDSPPSDTWYHHEANNRAVNNISIQFLYKPRTLTMLFICLMGMLIFAFARNEENMDNNIIHGVLFVVFMFQAVCALTFPNGPFIRPHPALWRMVLGQLEISSTCSKSIHLPILHTLPQPL